jgi:hypothetical protein
MRRRSTLDASARRLLIDGIDTLLIDPRSTTGQPDGWGWDWEAWRAPKAR